MQRTNRNLLKTYYSLINTTEMVSIAPNILSKYESWLNSPFIDDADKAELKAIETNHEEIEERFYKDMAFGTGGLRGKRGMGTNRLNKYVIRKASQGLANYMLAKDPESKSKGIVIAYDSRIQSTEFALNTAMVMAGNGIKAYLYESLRTTPQLSFSVRDLGAKAGIVVTASHNPPEYNGYKVYWEDGAQIVAPHDKGIIDEVNSIQDLGVVKLMEEAEAKEKGLIVMIGAEQDEAFIKAVAAEVIKPDAIAKVADSYPIVYTPLHGTGNIPVQNALKAAGFKHVHVVKEQQEPDGTFPTVAYPNPEEPEVFKLAIETAEKVGAKIAMANDPDADRIGVAVKNEAGEWVYPNGNQIGLLLTAYILSNLESIPSNGAVITTIVSSPMIDVVAEHYGVEAMRTLTGFKYIGEKIRQFEEGILDNTYLFGFEESYGYLKGTHARDKDAVVATMAIAEMAAYYESQGSDIPSELEKLYQKFGYYQEGLEAVKLDGKAGGEKIANIMQNFRENPPTEIFGQQVTILRDYKVGKEKNFTSNTESETGLPTSNVLQFVLADETVITVRPSGTEPKIKYYFGVKADSKEAVNLKLKEAKEAFLQLVK